jgi:hypothetical protein
MILLLWRAFIIGVAILGGVLLACYFRRKWGHQRTEFNYSQLPSMDAAYYNAMNRSTDWMDPSDDSTYQSSLTVEHIEGRPTLSL